MALQIAELPGFSPDWASWLAVFGQRQAMKSMKDNNKHSPLEYGVRHTLVLRSKAIIIICTDLLDNIS